MRERIPRADTPPVSILLGFDSLGLINFREQQTILTSRAFPHRRPGIIEFAVDPIRLPVNGTVHAIAAAPLTSMLGANFFRFLFQHQSRQKGVVQIEQRENCWFDTLLHVFTSASLASGKFRLPANGSR